MVGSGGTVGEWLVTDPRVDKITFTGSPDVGRHILAVAGIKKVTLELGNTSPVVIAPDADLDFVAKRCAVGAYYNSGQVCISVQRIYSQKQVYEAFSEKFVKTTNAMVVGDPLDERVDVGPMIDAKEVDRIEGWVKEAQAAGAKVLAGGKRDGTVYYPTVLADVQPGMKVVAEEVFAPVASVIACDDFEESLRQANDTKFGLQVGVFTRGHRPCAEGRPASQLRRRDHKRHAQLPRRPHAVWWQPPERPGPRRRALCDGRHDQHPDGGDPPES